MESDLALVQAVVAREAGAFSRFRKRTDRVVGQCLVDVIRGASWVRPHKEDLRQSFDLMLLDNECRALRSFEARSKLTTWVHVVARRFFRRRAAVLKPRPQVDPDRLEQTADSGDLPDVVQIRQDVITQTRARVRDLDEQEQLLLALLYEQGLNASDAGKVLGMKPSGVRMKKARLLKKLSGVLSALRE